MLSSRFEDAEHLLRWLTVDAVGDQLGVAENGIERRAQLVAHVGEELRFVLARDFELSAFVLDLVEQPRVLDRQHRLRGESLHQVDCILWEGARRLAAHDQGSRRYRPPRSSGATNRAR